MNKLKLNAIYIGVAAVFIIGCTNFSDEKEDQTYLARVGSSYLTLQEAKNEIPNFENIEDSSRAIATYRDQWIQRQVLLDEARSLQLEEQPEIQKRLQKAREEVLLQALKSVIVSEYENRSNINDSEVLNYYRQHKDQLVLNERYVKFRHIETPEISRARQARNELEDDSSWTRVARTFSLNPEEKIALADKFHPVSTLFKDFEVMNRYASTLDSGRISPIQRHRGNYHFLQITDVREQGEAAEAGWFTDELKTWLNREKQRKYYNSYVKNLYFSAKGNNEIELYNVNKLNINANKDTVNARTSN